ncbi:reverse transcriptase, partial [Tanacetum coccineum]
WNFQELRMEFMFQGQKVKLRGTNQSELTWMSGKSLSKQVSQKDAYLTSMCCMVPSVSLNLMQCGVDTQSIELQTLLEEYAYVFKEPKTLPPHRSFDHQIPLKEGEVNVNIRPYRYPPAQKDVIETMVKELLDSGVIRPSHGPFSSPIVMVKKKDGSWRMCIDYKQLNKFTVKDKFPIPVIEELIDKLQEHIDQLRMVLQVIRMNTLFEKKSKCVFGTDRVEYLGHVITDGGVETEPSKIQAMKEWPVPTNIKQLRGFLAFEELKLAMINSPVLALPNFDEEFVIETDASEIEYKKGKDNMVADALSRIERPAELFSLLCSGLS